VEKCLFIYRYVIIYIISVFSVLKVCCISHYIAYNLYEREIIMVEDNSSYGGGFALGFLLGIIGLLIALAVGTSGSNIRRGAGHGLLTFVVIWIFIFIFLVSCAGGGY
jgi:hypothetical protein